MKKRAHLWTRVWLRLRLLESSPPHPPPPSETPVLVWVRLSNFTWKWDPVLESTNLPSNGHENAAFCVLFHAVGARSYHWTKRIANKSFQRLPNEGKTTTSRRIPRSARAQNYLSAQCKRKLSCWSEADLNQIVSDFVPIRFTSA